MLAELSIRDLVLIPQITLRFGPGLNVLSGETGAGKSLIVGSLRLLCGDRPPPGIVRPGAERAIVEAVFELDPEGWIVRALRELDVDVEDGELILRREIPASGRGRIRANGLAIPIETLRRASELLVDLHGQHEHQSLFRPSFQGAALDEFAGLLDKRESFEATLAEWRRAREELEELGRRTREERERRELTRFQRRELEEADPRPGERAELLASRGRLERAELLRGTAARLADELLESERAVQEVLSNLADLARQAAEHDPEWDPVAEALTSLAIGATEVARDATALGEQAVDDPARLQEVRERLRVWDDLLRKYGPAEEDLFRFRDRLRETEEDPEAHERRVAALRERVDGISDRLARLGSELGRKRRRAASALASSIESVLAELGMEDASCEIRVEPRTQGLAIRGESAPERAGRSGLDEVAMWLAANRGQDARPLREIASGGEISRVMLGLKSVLGRVRGTATMVFDEIDAGVGGTIAARVGDTLAGIGESRQVLCITHLAAIASRAGSQFRVRKDSDAGATETSVDEVTGEERVREIARMLGGSETAETAVEHARELLKERA